MQHLHAGIEAILMVVDEPVSPIDLATALDAPELEVVAALRALRDDYANPDAPRGFELREVGGGWRIYSSPLFADAVGAFIIEGQSARMSQAALETLAVVAYRQPAMKETVDEVLAILNAEFAEEE